MKRIMINTKIAISKRPAKMFIKIIIVISENTHCKIPRINNAKYSALKSVLLLFIAVLLF
ncbi:hypothetical protein [Sebaldella sp. S0638]|uniref:hypothetical protein n=1 Tax=Sebaldella sp. S0638 TaxID=2957809 RepID=UPI00209FA3A8|nr:hypothetical protein [Sebaldella sp. S0638]